MKTLMRPLSASSIPMGRTVKIFIVPPGKKSNQTLQAEADDASAKKFNAVWLEKNEVVHIEVTNGVPL